MTKRQDKELRKSYHDMRCLICNKLGSDPTHIKSFGSGGLDDKNNLIPLCRIHHTEQHKIGIYSFSNKYPKFLLELDRLGWFFEMIGTKPKLLRK